MTMRIVAGKCVLHQHIDQMCWALGHSLFRTHVAMEASNPYPLSNLSVLASNQHYGDPNPVILKRRFPPRLVYRVSIGVRCGRHASAAGEDWSGIPRMYGRRSAQGDNSMCEACLLGEPRGKSKGTVSNPPDDRCGNRETDRVVRVSAEARSESYH
jgi:hypothetical protein